MTILMPVELRERARRVAKRVRKSSADLIREGLRDRVELYETKFSVEEERAREQKETKPKGRHLKSLAPSRESAPSANENRVDEAVLDAPAPYDALAPLYVEHAKKIFAVLEQPLDRRMRVQEAIVAIRRAAERAAPLTYKPMLDGDILVALEREVLKLRAAAPAQSSLLAADAAAPPSSPTMQRLTRFVDDFVGRTIDPGRVRTAGDV